MRISAVSDKSGGTAFAQNAGYAIGRAARDSILDYGDGDPSDGFGERRGVSPPVLHLPVSPTILRFQPAALRLAARSGVGREARGSVFSYRTRCSNDITLADGWAPPRS